jgi:hypothetical protein
VIIRGVKLKTQPFLKPLKVGLDERDTSTLKTVYRIKNVVVLKWLNTRLNLSKLVGHAPQCVINVRILKNHPF